MIRRAPTVSAAVPTRTCVGCRKREAITELLRVVAVKEESGHRLVPDLRRRLPGRGASLHLDPGCLGLATRRRAFSRALRVPEPLDLTPLSEYVAAHAR